MNIEWMLKPFETLTNNELYKILQLRLRVFVVEQQCPFLDMDDKDQQAKHLCAWIDDKLVAYTRILPPGITYNEASIGRVVTASTVRGTGIGKALLQRSIDTVYQLYGHVPIRIGAQLYLKKFYESFGFVQDSEIYSEDNIDHIKMVLA